MISKGNTHKNGMKLARYMTTAKEGEHVVFGELRGFASDDITKAFRSIHVMAEGTKCEQPFFHVQVRNPDGEKLTRAQWQHVADRIESKLGLTDQPRAIVFHVNRETGHEHMHVAWSRIDAETMTAIPLPFFKERLKEVSRELEKELDLTRVRNERDGPVQAPDRNEFEEARRLGVDIKQVRQVIRDCWEHSDNGASFRVALAEYDLTLAQGDRRDFIVLDHEGGLHALGKRILGVSAAQTRSRLSDIDRDELPTIAQARERIAEHRRDAKDQSMPDPDLREMAWQDALAKAAIEKEKSERRFIEPKRHGEVTSDREKESRIWEETAYATTDKFQDAGLETLGSTGPKKPLNGIEKQLWGAYRSGQEAHDFAAALDSQGIAFARATPDEAYKSYREAQFAKAVGRIAPVYQENEVVAVRSPGPEYLRHGEWTELPRVQKLDQAHAQKYLAALGLDKSKLSGIDATKETLKARSAERTADWDRIRLGNSQRINRVAPEKTKNVKAPAMLGKVASKAVSSALDVVGSALESVLSPVLTPQQKHEGERETLRRQTDAGERIDLSSTLARLAQDRERRKQEGQLAQQPQIDERER